MPDEVTDVTQHVNGMVPKWQSHHKHNINLIISPLVVRFYVVVTMLSAVARQASYSSRRAVRKFSAEAAEKKLNPFSIVDNPIGGGIVLLGLTAAMGAVMYK